jgi:hypothetical protein
MTIKIEKGIPIPLRNSGRKYGERAEAILKMSIGDSFLIHAHECANIYSTADRHRMKIRMSSLPEFAPKGMKRVWRIA